MLMFGDILKVYASHAVSFSKFFYLILQRCYFHKFSYFSDNMYFQLPWILKRAVAKALKLKKMTAIFRHRFFTGQIVHTGFREDIFCL